MAARRGSRFVPAPGLEALVARRILAPHVADVAADIADEARRGAPSAKMWLSMRDDRVRPSHVDADGQEIPENLRFQVGSELLREPRDPNGSIGETANCRCESPRDPDAIRRRIAAGPVEVAGTRVSATVSVEFPRIDEAEFGTPEDPGLRFMGNAARTVASRSRAR